MLAEYSLRLLYICLSTDIHNLLLAIYPYDISTRNTQSSYIKILVKHTRSLFYFFFTPLPLLVLITLSIMNTFSACLFDFHVG